MTEDEEALPRLLQQIVKDIKDPKCSYWIKANYYDVQPPTQRQVTRWWQAPLYVNYNALWNSRFEENAVQMDVVLKDTLPAEYERIRIEYNQIWSQEQHYKDKDPESDDGWMLFHDSAKLKMPPVNAK